MRHFTISPSDLTFLWNECKRCFYLKLRHDFRRPASPFPKIFSTIDLYMKDIYLNQSTKKICAQLPEGKAIMSGRWVASEPIHFEGSPNTCSIRGIFDTLVQFEDGSYGIIDFKTTRVNEAHIAFYSRQLQAYAYALEHPAPGKARFAPVTRLGLLCFDPAGMQEEPPAQLNLIGPATWQEIPLDENAFLQVLAEVMQLLDQPQPPEAGENCAFREYRRAARATEF